MNRNLQIDNHTLVEECKKGDKEALNLFYLRFAPRMLSVIRRYVSDVNDAEDILHDGFIVAFTRLGSLRDFDRVDYWLATIMKNLSLKFLQSQDLAKMLHDLPEVEDTPQIDDIIDLETLESLIKKLPAGYQKVFRLAVLENKSHKEIARILGIAPNSSSSQLFHAKLMMRKLIIDYKKQAGLLSLLLIATTAGFFFWKRTVDSSITTSSGQILISNNQSRIDGNQSVSQDNSVSSKNKLTATTNSTSSGSGTPTSGFTSGIASSNPADTLTTATDNLTSVENQNLIKDEKNIIAEKNVLTDNEAIARKDNDSIISLGEPLYAYSDPYGNDYIPVTTSKENEWSVKVSAMTGIKLPDLSSDESFANGELSDPTYPGFMGPDSNVGGNNRDYKDVSHVNHMPVAFSLSVTKALNKTLSIESGLTYTYLHTSFHTGHTTSDARWHYLGIPLKLNINTFSYQKVRLYAAVGASIDLPLYSKSDVQSTYGEPELKEGKFNSPIVWTLSASYGLALNLTDWVEIFIEPNLQYHFPQHYTVPNGWTDNLCSFSLPVGFRFKW